MNTGAFGENFPYSNFHDLNMDWIIKIAKDFLDQYTHIQEVISNGEQSLQNLTTEGLAQLQTKADALEALLQEWYNTHSADIANQLTEALADLNRWYSEHQNYLDAELTRNINAFNARAEEKAQQTIATIPSDYSELSTLVNETFNGAFFDYNKSPFSLGYNNRSMIIYTKRVKPNIDGSADSDDYRQSSTVAYEPIITGEKYFVIIPSNVACRFFFYSGNTPDTITHYTGWHTNKNYELPITEGDAFYRIATLPSDGSQPVYDTAALEPEYLRYNVKVYHGKFTLAQIAQFAQDKNVPYFTEGYSIEFHPHASTGVTDVIINTADGEIRYRGKYGGSHYQTLADAAEHISFATIVDNTITFAVPANTSLYWDDTTYRIESAVPGNIPENFCELITVRYANPTSGLWVILHNYAKCLNLQNEYNNLYYSFISNYSIYLNNLQGMDTWLNTLKGLSENNYTCLFFTDPHKIYTTRATLESIGTYLANVQKAFNIGNLDEVVCGGDWITYGVSKENAMYALSYVSGLCARMFRNRYHSVFGNHDSNVYSEPGTQDPERELTYSETARLTVNTYAKNLYYFYETDNARIIVLNTGDQTETTNEEIYNQFTWLAHRLNESTKPVIIYAHAIFYTTTGEMFVPSQSLMQLLNLYNSHAVGTVQGVSYDFSNATQKVCAVLSGHKHTYMVNTEYGIPVIAGRNYENSGDFYYLAFDFNTKKLSVVDNQANTKIIYDMP